jgi:antitoxin component YwqK of YwqJK toxin-antitoxin module
MKLKILFLFLTLSSLAFGQTFKDSPMQEQWGLVQINDSLLADQTEIRVGEWLDYIFYHDATDSSQYLFWRKRMSQAELDRLLNVTIDSALLPDKDILNQLPEKYLFKKCKNCELISFKSLDTKVQLPVEKDSLKTVESKKRLVAYLNLPIVGIRYEQAVAFCKWRTYIDSIRWAAFSNSQPSWNRHDYVFQLPTPEQFNQMNTAFDSVNKEKESVSLFNYKNAKYPSIGAKEDEKKQFGNSRIGVYHLHLNTKNNSIGIQGNVAEMTSVKGIAMGGSYYQYAKDSYANKNNYYQKPELWLGFRCVVIRGPVKFKDPCIYKINKHKNGKIKEEGRECEVAIEQKKHSTVIENQKEGIWKNYNEDGSLWSEYTYKNGEATGFYKKFYKNGSIHETGQVMNSQNVDTVKIYEENGSLISVIVFALTKEGGYEIKSEKFLNPDAKPDNTIEDIDGEIYIWKFGERKIAIVYDNGLRRRSHTKKKKNY